MMNEALKRFIAQDDAPLTESQLRQVLRQEMPENLRGLTTEKH
jgi:hypothetical protein